MKSKSQIHSEREGTCLEPYEKPRLRVIELVAGEVLAIGCKMATSAGPTQPTCTAVVCVNPGS